MKNGTAGNLKRAIEARNGEGSFERVLIDALNEHELVWKTAQAFGVVEGSIRYWVRRWGLVRADGTWSRVNHEEDREQA